MIFVTGGAGFIGSNFINYWFKNCQESLVNIDSLTYAGNLENLARQSNNPNYIFHKTDITDLASIEELFEKYKPRAILNFAAESHVDRSITKPDTFIQTNIIGTFNLLEVSKKYLKNLASEQRENFRFLHVSTDEVYGSLGSQDPAFNEQTAYAPNSPYSASKAASDHLVRAYFHTYKLPTLTTNCSNNYGPHQYPEKLIPLMISNCLEMKALPIYGNGLNVRDWLFVDDHCEAIALVLKKGRIGETYNIGGLSEKTNIDVVDTICKVLDEVKPLANGKSYLSLKQFVQDRPGHDLRYAIDINKINQELGWTPSNNFESGIRKTIMWYLDNPQWIKNLKSKEIK